jgi:hypothetical protein
MASKAVCVSVNSAANFSRAFASRAATTFAPKPSTRVTMQA